VRVGIAGTGRIGARHARVLATHPDVTELVLNDDVEQRAREVAAEVDGTVATSVAELFEAKPDAVLIATATFAHADLIEAASDAGVPVFCEKPVAQSAARTEEVLRHVTKTGVPVHVGFQRRFDPGYVEARRRVQAGEMGEVRRVHLITADPAPPGPEFIPTSGGIFRDCHIHDLDILRWVTGREVVEVYAVGANRGANYFREADDVDESAALLVLDDGTLATMQGSRYNGAGYDVRMELAGTDGTHVVGLADRSPLRSTEPDTTFPVGEPWVIFYERFGAAYTAELTAFIDMAAGRRESPCTVLDGLKAFYAAEAADLSRREHRPVRVEEVTGR
jgi:myo-inositol 2-dehydrogenase / D-chiro-inositol 1-dehydrogenase